MKILKVRIKRVQDENGTHYIYPIEYDSKKIGVLCYETTNMDNYEEVVNRGNDYEFMIGVVKDEYMNDFLKSEYIEELSYDEALLTGNSWVKREDRIIDNKKIISILNKINSDIPLSKKEKDAIDPNSKEIGLNKNKSFKDILDESLV